VTATKEQLVEFQLEVNAETVRSQAEHIRELEGVLRNIDDKYDDADWPGASSIPPELIQRARKLVE
jgi:hypothetical protein